jgi:hypothetical protein
LPAVVEVDPQRVPEAAQEHAPPRLPKRPRPKLAAVTRQPIGSALDFLHDAVEIMDVATKVEMSDAYIGYIAWCRAKSLWPMEADEFFNEVSDLCLQFGIPIREDEGGVYLVNVRLGPLVAARERGRRGLRARDRCSAARRQLADTNSPVHGAAVRPHAQASGVEPAATY